MGFLRRRVRRLARLLGRDTVERSMTEEMRFHLEMETRELLARGHSPAEARRLARVRFGGVERYKEEGRDARGRLTMDAARDIRYALRGVRRRPAFTAAVVATLAIAIGATTAVWSLVDAVLLRPLPYPAAERLMRVQVGWSGEAEGALSPAEYLDYRRGTGEVFSAVAAYVSTSVTAAADGGAGAERLDAALVAADLFGVLGIEPLLGRPFTEEEELGGDRPVVVSEGYWRSRLGADPGAVGSSLTISRLPYTIVGVMPASFRLPENLVDGARPSFYLPLGIHPDTTYRRGSHFLQAAARLRDGVPPARAAESVAGVTARFIPDFPDDYEPEMAFWGTAVPLREAVVGQVRPALMVALGAVVLVLLVGAANVAALLLSRGEARRSEMALRATLGARRVRLVRQLLLETLVLAIAGGLAGVALAWIAVRGLIALNPPGIPRVEAIGLHGPVLAFAAGLSIMCGLLFGLLPALRTARDGTAGALREAGTRTTAGRGLRRALVIGEVALALALLAGAGLLGRSMNALLAVDTGLRMDDVIATEFTVPGSSHPEDQAVRDFVAAAAERVAALPEVEAAGAITNVPLAEGIGDLGVEIPGRELPGDGNLNVDWQAVTPGYDRAVGLRLLAGRWVDGTDREDAPGAIVINRTFAERWWPDGDALGAPLRLTAEASPAEARVVGIVDDVAHEGPAAPATLQMYIPHRQFGFWYGQGPARAMAMVVRPRAGVTTAPAAVRQAFAELDPDMGLGQFMTLEGAYRDTLSRPRLLAALMATFAAVALLLASLGIYGVIAYGVGRRRREFGIRMALGAPAARVAREVLTEGAGLAAAGIGLGLLGALLLSGTLRSLLFGVSTTDPLVLIAGAATLFCVAILASWVPARRAVRVHPSEALREE